MTGQVHYVRLKPLAVDIVVRTVLFARDLYRCVYCGIPVTFESGTVDHYIPKHHFKKTGKGKAAASTWFNMVVSCEHCNTRKADHLPKECGMHPQVYPMMPSVVRYSFPDLKYKRIQKQLIAEFITHDLETGEWRTSKASLPT